MQRETKALLCIHGLIGGNAAKLNSISFNILQSFILETDEDDQQSSGISSIDGKKLIYLIVKSRIPFVKPII